ncbi:alpha-ribazole phosphatase [Desulfotomaculum sp. 1211_IL3151]|uniref:alpha-ribazole phosphatase n=1 Tax=Desulfotomaculum sp. 1211_IL3151 TaxID=3084055 RepID=UPI002FD955D9
MEATKLYLVRHGETEWNAGGRFQGHSDVPLSNFGRQQAERLALSLKQTKIDAFYSSDLSRAMETAQIIVKEHGTQVNYLPDLREINFGVWEGLTYDQISQNYGNLSVQWRSNPLDTQIPHGEKLQDLAERCQRAINEIINQHAGENVLVASHGGVIRVIVANALGFDLNHFWKLRLDNVSLTVLEYYGQQKAILELFNDTCHLK